MASFLGNSVFWRTFNKENQNIITTLFIPFNVVAYVHDCERQIFVKHR